MARERTRNKVYEAVLALAREQRVGSITMEGLAARAGVSKQTLYRTWSSTGEILFEALLARSVNEDGVVVTPNSGDLAADLTLLTTATIAELTEPTQEALLRAVTAEIQSDESLAEQFRGSLLTPQFHGIAERLRQDGVLDPDGVAELFVAPIFHRWLLRRGPFDSAWVAAHVARILRAAGEARHPKRPPGSSVDSDRVH